MSTDRIHRMTEVFARLSPDATIESARTEVSTITSRIHSNHPEAYDAGSGFDVTVTPLKTQLTSRARPTLLLLLATVSVVLIIACANLANLTLTRVLRRGHEMAIRASLGASRSALRRALWMENVVLAVAGAGLGLAIAFVGFDLLVNFSERFTSRASEIALDGSVLGFALVAAIAASVLFTLVPPLPGGDKVGFSLARGGTRSTDHSRARWAQRALVVAQISMSFVLLIGAGLLFRTMRHLNQIDPGFDTEQVLAMEVPSSDWESTPPAQFQSLYESILRDVDALPAVESAALTSALPLTNTSGGFTTQWVMDVEGYEPAPGVPSPRADFRVVSRR